MATFEKATLVLVPDDESQTARVEVSCEVHYRDEEVALMRQNPEQTFFSLFCTLVGRDAGTVAPLDTDDWLYTFATQSLPAGPPPPAKRSALKPRWATTCSTRTSSAPTRSMPI